MSVVCVPALLYHSVAEEVDHRFAPWAMRPGVFAEHMALLAERGYEALTVSEFVDRHLAARAPVTRPTVLITFDDGFADFHGTAWPILREHDLRATVYVTTGCVGATSRWLARLGEGERPMMTWDQIADLDAAGIECGGHTATHPQLDTVPVRRARDEIAASRQALAAVIGPPRSFAYPHGYHTRRLRELVRAAGYDSACAVGGGPALPAGGRFTIQRAAVYRDTTTSQLERLLDSQPGRAARGLRSVMWRGARRAGADRLRETVRCGGG